MRLPVNPDLKYHVLATAGGCAAMIRLLNSSQAAAQDAAIFTIASLIKWNVVDVLKSFARNQGEAAGFSETSRHMLCCQLGSLK